MASDFVVSNEHQWLVSAAELASFRICNYLKAIQSTATVYNTFLKSF